MDRRRDHQEDRRFCIFLVRCRTCGTNGVACLLVVDLVDLHDGSLVRLLCHGDRFSVVSDGHGCDTLTAIDALIHFLGLLLHVVDDDVVARGVHYLVVIEEENVVGNICLQS